MAILDILPDLDDRRIHQVNLGRPIEDPRDPVTPRPPGYDNDHRHPGVSINGGSNFGSQSTMTRSGLRFEDYDPFIRDVTDDELVENRLTNLLRSDSRYIQQARERGAIAAAERGGLSGSMFAEASEASAIQAGMPIATADAQAYRQAASENLQHLNNNILSRLQAATQIELSRMSENQAVRVAEIQTAAQKYMQEIANEHAKTMFELSADHDNFMENIRQGGRVEIANLSHTFQKELMGMGFEHDFNMSELTHDQRIQVEEMFNDPRFYAQLDFQRNQMNMNMMAMMTQMYAEGINSMNMQDIDEAAFSRGARFFEDLFKFGMGLMRQVDEKGFPEIDFGGNP